MQVQCVKATPCSSVRAAKPATRCGSRLTRPRRAPRPMPRARPATIARKTCIWTRPMPAKACGSAGPTPATKAAANYAEVMCATDSAPATIVGADAEGKAELTTVVTRFIEGDEDANSFDNLDFQPGSGNLYVIEDHAERRCLGLPARWCRPRPEDRWLHHGCCRSRTPAPSRPASSLRPMARPPMSAIQHSDDTGMAAVDGYGTDDVLVISGFAPVAK